MLALGCTEKQIGLIASVGLIFQMIFSFFSGYITDKLGRRLTIFIFDVIAWSIPTLIWEVAQNFYYLIIASMINSIGTIVGTSYNCLLVEDTNSEKRVYIFTWYQIAGILSGFVVPLAGLKLTSIHLQDPRARHLT